MDNFRVLLSSEGKLKAPQSYILVLPQPDGMQIYSDCTLLDWLQATVCVYDGLIAEAMNYSDQDLYEACKMFDIDYDTIATLVREARNNE